MPAPLSRNTLFYGDNLTILRDHIAGASVDLVYLDPPFNSNRNYNVLFRNESGVESEAQIQAFVDTWHWNQAAADQYHALITGDHLAVGTLIAAFHTFISPQSPMLAYLVMMAARLVELHRVLKPTGSLYLHCDPTASHYLKVMLDTIFGVENFRNELAWRRTTTKNDYRQGATNWPRVHDVILYYAKNVDAPPPFNQAFADYSEDYVRSKYGLVDEQGRHYMLDNLTAPGAGSRGHPQYELMGVTRYWRYNKDKMDRLILEGRVVQPRPGAVPRYKRYLDEMPGVAIGDVWTDIDNINSQAAERLGYPTQKPVALLDRIVAASSNPGDVVLDPFCGCGTTIAAAQQLGRRWIGIDLTHLSIALQKYRLKDSFGLVAKQDYDVIGEPVDLGSARQLAEDNRYQFQWWALSLIQARPLGGEPGSKQGKKGADQGIDGVITFVDELAKPKRVIVQVKSGHVSNRDIRDLAGTMQASAAPIGVFITLEPPSAPMLTAAAAAGHYHSPGWNRDYPALQILTIDELLAGKRVAMPSTSTTFRTAETVSKPSDDQLTLGLGSD